MSDEERADWVLKVRGIAFCEGCKRAVFTDMDDKFLDHYLPDIEGLCSGSGAMAPVRLTVGQAQAVKYV